MNRTTLSQAALLLAILITAAVSAASLSAEPADLSGITVCLDPGHGGLDPGATNGAFALYESHINLDVSYRLKALLEGDGAEVVLTRYDNDTYLTNADRYTYCNEQEATILVSVHTNSVTYEDWDGSMALYAPSRDDDLARAIHEVMYPFLRDTAPAGVAEFRDYGIDNFASGVLFKCNMPAAMMEPLFMSHPAEAALLVYPLYSDYADPDAPTPNPFCAVNVCRRGQIAEAIHLGVLNYFGAGGEPGETPEMHVAAVEMSYIQRKAANFVTSVVTAADSGGDPVSGAAVAHTFTLPDGSIVIQTGTTGDDGTAAFKVRSRLSGLYKSTVTSISKTGWLYDPASNTQTSAILILP